MLVNLDAGSDASVGVFIDGVYAGRAGGYRADMFDIERVEVVKGPAASTLYGTEASGGVVQIFTKRGQRGAPRFVFSSEVQRSDLASQLPWALTPVDLDGAPVRPSSRTCRRLFEGRYRSMSFCLILNPKTRVTDHRSNYRSVILRRTILGTE